MFFFFRHIRRYRGLEDWCTGLNFEVEVCLPGCFCFYCLAFEVISEGGEDLFRSGSLLRVRISLGGGL